MNSQGTEDRLLELLCQRAIEGLSPGETGELRMLLKAHPGVDPDQFDQAAAWVDLACLKTESEMPAALQTKIAEQAVATLAGRGENDASRSGNVVAMDTRRATTRRTAPAWFAAAASLVIAFALWMRGPEIREVPVEVERIVEVAPQLPPPEQRLASLEQQASELVRSSWQLTDDYADLAVDGDVVWSAQHQEGYMVFRGLPANDPAQNQYQLWIFDATRDDSFPVDGGVFDMPADAAEVVVPITAGVPVRKATLFAITREKSGGVVVSDREELMLVASVN